ncbi:MAG: autoinducer binding domain-containing protein, partial [Rhodospirillaceae bacterium]
MDVANTPNQCAKGSMQTDIAGILSDLEALNSEDAFRQKLDRTFDGLGFSKFCYLGLKPEATSDIRRTPSPDDSIFLTNLPSAWTEHYIEENFRTDDPIVRECMASRLPVIWSEKLRKKVGRASRADAVLASGVDFDVRRGVSVPIHGPSGELGLMSLYSSLHDREFNKTADAYKYDLQVLSIYFHDALQKKLTHQEDIPKPIPLTDREVEILQWTAMGKTAWEIGTI